LFVRIPQARHSVEVTTETRRQVSGFDVTIFMSDSELLIKLRLHHRNGVQKENYSEASA
jgi:hypothetical protein